MTTKKNSSAIRDEFHDLATKIYEQKQEEAGLPVPRLTVSLRTDMELVAQLDELADRLDMTRQACALMILEQGLLDAIGGYLDVFPENAPDFWEGSQQRFADFRAKQMEKFNKREGGDA